MNILIIGSGYVGFETGKLLEKFHSVTYYDVDENRIAELKEQGKNVTLNLSEGVADTEIAFICVPTPSKDGKIDLSYVEGVARKLEIDKEYAVVIKSTVTPGTAKKIKSLLPEKVKLFSNPEFITQISKSWSDDPAMAGNDSHYFIIGGENTEVLEKLYEPYGIKIYKMSNEEAEFIKYMNNCILASRISVYNEFLLAAKHAGDIDTHKLAKILSLDPRIGVYGSVHGKAYGGTCFPKDTKAFLAYLKEKGFDAKILKAVIETNNEMNEKHGVRE